MNAKISLAHGSGGKLMHNLIKDVFLAQLGNPILKPLRDSAVIELGGTKIAFTTDSYVVNPIFFPGGDIGELAVCGTVNDLAVMGAKPLYISCSYIIEEGFEYNELAKITVSVSKAANASGVFVVTGDTKVVEKGKGDKIFINTSGIGICEYGFKEIEVGDKILINGGIGEHEIAILTARGGLDFDVQIKSDCAPLVELISQVLKGTPLVKFMRDPTRGGVATVLNELVEGMQFGIMIYENAIPMKPEVNGVCALLGFDPLYLANEGKVILVVGGSDANRVLNLMRTHELGKEAQIIGEVVASPVGKVCMKTQIGGTRIVDMLVGEQLPRIC